MMSISNNTKIVGFGIVTAMRSTFGLGILSHFLNKNPCKSLKHSKLNFIQSPVTAMVTKALCVGEIVGDKLPAAADRIGFPQILGRVATGALCGAIIATDNNKSLTKGVLLGGTSALAASYAFFHLRKFIHEQADVKDVYIGAVEDALALGTGIALME